jgi:hypothetical protein
MSNPTTPLIELRHHYQNIIAQAEYQVTQAKSQIEHIDALLLDGLLQAQEPNVLKADLLFDLPALAASPATDLDTDAPSQPDSNSPKAKAPATEVRATKTQPKPKPKTAKAPSSGRESFPLLPAYEGMNKLEAIGQILSEQSGHVLHQDTIIQLLYGDLSPEVLKVESRRMRASLFQGLTKGLWQRALKQPSSYILGKTSKARKQKSSANEGVTPTKGAATPTASSSQNEQSTEVATAKPGKKSKTEPKAATPKKSSSRGREQVLSLPAEYTGLSKIDTVAKVLDKHKGKVMHMDEIIEQLYGKLSGEDLKAEKVRMKDVMTRGVKRNLWRKAEGVPSSIIVGTQSQAASSASSKRPSKTSKSGSSVNESKPKTTSQRRRRSSAGE